MNDICVMVCAVMAFGILYGKMCFLEERLKEEIRKLKERSDES